VDEQQMLKNVELTQGRMMSEAVMMALSKKGVNRQEAHELLRKLALKSEIEKKPFKQVLLENEFVRKKITEKELEEVVDPKNYLGTAVKQAEQFAQD
jgi:adenylosuccinate lyase